MSIKDHVAAAAENVAPQVQQAGSERRFNPWRRTRTAKARAVVSEVTRLLEDHEGRLGARKRGRKPVDQRTMEETINALVSDLLYHHAGQRHGGVYVTRSKTILGKRSRYRPAVYSKKLPAFLDALSSPELEIVEQDVGGQLSFSSAEAKRTVVRPGRRLLSVMGTVELKEDDFIERGGAETIILKRAKEDYWDEGGMVEYAETAATIALRKNVERINDWLAGADLDFSDHLAIDGNTPMIDLQDRRLRRIFTQGSFESGGRLFGGFWQTMSGPRRLRAIFIDGEDIAELDYGQMAPRILYGRAGAAVPEGDLYSIPNFERQRSGVKTIMNSMLFADGPLRRFPKGARQLFPDRCVAIEDVTSAIEARHVDLKPFFGTGIGHWAQFVESEIMVDLLLTLKADNAVALPIHDAVLVPRSRADDVREVMLNVFRKHAGVPGEITTE